MPKGNLKDELNDFFYNGIESCQDYEDYLTHMTEVLAVDAMAAYSMNELYWQMGPRERLQMDDWHTYFKSQGIRFHEWVVFKSKKA